MMPHLPGGEDFCFSSGRKRHVHCNGCHRVGGAPAKGGLPRIPHHDGPFTLSEFIREYYGAALLATASLSDTPEGSGNTTRTTPENDSSYKMNIEEKSTLKDGEEKRTKTGYSLPKAIRLPPYHKIGGMSGTSVALPVSPFTLYFYIQQQKVRTPPPQPPRSLQSSCSSSCCSPQELDPLCYSWHYPHSSSGVSPEDDDTGAVDVRTLCHSLYSTRTSPKDGQCGETGGRKMRHMEILMEDVRALLYEGYAEEAVVVSAATGMGEKDKDNGQTKSRSVVLQHYLHRHWTLHFLHQHEDFFVSLLVQLCALDVRYTNSSVCGGGNGLCGLTSSQGSSITFLTNSVRIVAQLQPLGGAVQVFGAPLSRSVGSAGQGSGIVGAWRGTKQPLSALTREISNQSTTTTTTTSSSSSSISFSSPSSCGMPVPLSSRYRCHSFPWKQLQQPQQEGKKDHNTNNNNNSSSSSSSSSWICGAHENEKKSATATDGGTLREGLAIATAATAAANRHWAPADSEAPVLPSPPSSSSSPSATPRSHPRTPRQRTQYRRRQRRWATKRRESEVQHRSRVAAAAAAVPPLVISSAHCNVEATLNNTRHHLFLQVQNEGKAGGGTPLQEEQCDQRIDKPVAVSPPSHWGVQLPVAMEPIEASKHCRSRVRAPLSVPADLSIRSPCRVLESDQSHDYHRPSSESRSEGNDGITDKGQPLSRSPGGSYPAHLAEVKEGRGRGRGRGGGGGEEEGEVQTNTRVPTVKQSGSAALPVQNNTSTDGKTSAEETETEEEEQHCWEALSRLDLSRLPLLLHTPQDAVCSSTTTSSTAAASPSLQTWWLRRHPRSLRAMLIAGGEQRRDLVHATRWKACNGKSGLPSLFPSRGKFITTPPPPSRHPTGHQEHLARLLTPGAEVVSPLAAAAGGAAAAAAAALRPQTRVSLIGASRRTGMSERSMQGSFVSAPVEEVMSAILVQSTGMNLRGAALKFVGLLEQKVKNEVGWGERGGPSPTREKGRRRTEKKNIPLLSAPAVPATAPAATGAAPEWCKVLPSPDPENTMDEAALLHHWVTSYHVMASPSLVARYLVHLLAKWRCLACLEASGGASSCGSRNDTFPSYASPLTTPSRSTTTTTTTTKTETKSTRPPVFVTRSDDCEEENDCPSCTDSGKDRFSDSPSSPLPSPSSSSSSPIHRTDVHSFFSCFWGDNPRTARYHLYGCLLPVIETWLSSPATSPSAPLPMSAARAGTTMRQTNDNNNNSNSNNSNGSRGKKRLRGDDDDDDEHLYTTRWPWWQYVPLGATLRGVRLYRIPWLVSMSEPVERHNTGTTTTTNNNNNTETTGSSASTAAQNVERPVQDVDAGDEERLSLKSSSCSRPLVGATANGGTPADMDDEEEQRNVRMPVRMGIEAPIQRRKRALVFLMVMRRLFEDILPFFVRQSFHVFRREGTATALGIVPDEVASSNEKDNISIANKGGADVVVGGDGLGYIPIAIWRQLMRREAQYQGFRRASEITQQEEERPFSPCSHGEAPSPSKTKDTVLDLSPAPVTRDDNRQEEKNEREAGEGEVEEGKKSNGHCRHIHDTLTLNGTSTSSLVSPHVDAVLYAALRYLPVYKKGCGTRLRPIATIRRAGATRAFALSPFRTPPPPPSPATPPPVMPTPLASALPWADRTAYALRCRLYNSLLSTPARTQLETQKNPLQSFASPEVRGCLPGGRTRSSWRWWWWWQKQAQQQEGLHGALLPSTPPLLLSSSSYGTAGTAWASTDERPKTCVPAELCPGGHEGRPVTAGAAVGGGRCGVPQERLTSTTTAGAAASASGITRGTKEYGALYRHSSRDTPNRVELAVARQCLEHAALRHALAEGLLTPLTCLPTKCLLAPPSAMVTKTSFTRGVNHDTMPATTAAAVAAQKPRIHRRGYTTSAPHPLRQLFAGLHQSTAEREYLGWRDFVSRFTAAEYRRRQRQQHGQFPSERDAQETTARRRRRKWKNRASDHQGQHERLHHLRLPFRTRNSRTLHGRNSRKCEPSPRRPNTSIPPSPPVVFVRADGVRCFDRLHQSAVWKWVDVLLPSTRAPTTRFDVEVDHSKENTEGKTAAAIAAQQQEQEQHQEQVVEEQTTEPSTWSVVSSLHSSSGTENVSKSLRGLNEKTAVQTERSRTVDGEKRNENNNERGEAYYQVRFGVLANTVRPTSARRSDDGNGVRGADTRQPPVWSENLNEYGCSFFPDGDLLVSQREIDDGTLQCIPSGWILVEKPEPTPTHEDRDGGCCRAVCRSSCSSFFCPARALCYSEDVRSLLHQHLCASLVTLDPNHQPVGGAHLLFEHEASPLQPSQQQRRLEANTHTTRTENRGENEVEPSIIPSTSLTAHDENTPRTATNNSLWSQSSSLRGWYRQHLRGIPQGSAVSTLLCHSLLASTVDLTLMTRVMEPYEAQGPSWLCRRIDDILMVFALEPAQAGDDGRTGDGLAAVAADAAAVLRSGCWETTVGFASNAEKLLIADGRMETRVLTRRSPRRRWDDNMCFGVPWCGIFLQCRARWTAAKRTFSGVLANKNPVTGEVLDDLASAQPTCLEENEFSSLLSQATTTTTTTTPLSTSPLFSSSCSSVSSVVCSSLSLNDEEEKEHNGDVAPPRLAQNPPFTTSTSTGTSTTTRITTDSGRCENADTESGSWEYTLEACMDWSRTLAALQPLLPSVSHLRSCSTREWRYRCFSSSSRTQETQGGSRGNAGERAILDSTYVSVLLSYTHRLFNALRQRSTATVLLWCGRANSAERVWRTLIELALAWSAHVVVLVHRLLTAAAAARPSLVYLQRRRGGRKKGATSLSSGGTLGEKEEEEGNADTSVSRLLSSRVWGGINTQCRARRRRSRPFSFPRPRRVEHRMCSSGAMEQRRRGLSVVVVLLKWLLPWAARQWERVVRSVHRRLAAYHSYCPIVRLEERAEEGDRGRPPQQQTRNEKKKKKRWNPSPAPPSHVHRMSGRVLCGPLTQSVIDREIHRTAGSTAAVHSRKRSRSPDDISEFDRARPTAQTREKRNEETEDEEEEEKDVDEEERGDTGLRRRRARLAPPPSSETDGRITVAIAFCVWTAMRKVLEESEGEGDAPPFFFFFRLANLKRISRSLRAGVAVKCEALKQQLLLSREEESSLPQRDSSGDVDHDDDGTDNNIVELLLRCAVIVSPYQQIRDYNSRLWRDAWTTVLEAAK